MKEHERNLTTPSPPTTSPAAARISTGSMKSFRNSKGVSAIYLVLHAPAHRKCRVSAHTGTAEAQERRQRTASQGQRSQVLGARMTHPKLKSNRQAAERQPQESRISEGFVISNRVCAAQSIRRISWGPDDIQVPKLGSYKRTNNPILDFMERAQIRQSDSGPGRERAPSAERTHEILLHIRSKMQRTHFIAQHEIQARRVTNGLHRGFNMHRYTTGRAAPSDGR